MLCTYRVNSIIFYFTQGGVNGDISVTAFVLIAMLECPCPDQVNMESGVMYKRIVIRLLIEYTCIHLSRTSM